jgi:hypothetical protein
MTCRDKNGPHPDLIRETTLPPQHGKLYYHRVRKVKNTTECVIGTPYSEGKQKLLRVIIAPTPTIPTIGSDPNPLSLELKYHQNTQQPWNASRMEPVCPKSTNRKEVKPNGIYTRAFTIRKCHLA